MFGHKKPPKPSLRKALTRIDQAIKIAYKYKHDKHYIPTRADLKHFERLLYKLRLRIVTAEHISLAMHRRFMEERERRKRDKRDNLS